MVVAHAEFACGHIPRRFGQRAGIRPQADQSEGKGPLSSQLAHQQGHVQADTGRLGAQRRDIDHHLFEMFPHRP